MRKRCSVTGEASTAAAFCAVSTARLGRQHWVQQALLPLLKEQTALLTKVILEARVVFACLFWTVSARPSSKDSRWSRTPGLPESSALSASVWP